MVQLTDKHWAVEVPDDATHIKIHESYQCSKIVFSSDIQDPLKCGGDMIRIPPGSWQYLFTTKGCTEEDARKVVLVLNNGVYHDYAYPIFDPCDEYAPCYLSAIESLQSLLNKKGCDINKNFSIIQKQSDNGITE